MKLRIRKQSAPMPYPNETVRVMRPQIINAWLAVKHHYSQRRKLGSGPAREWARALKRIDAGSD